MHLVQIKVIMYRKYMHLKISEEKERRGEYAQDVVRILWRELQKVDRMQVLGFLVALVIPNAVIQGILSSPFFKCFLLYPCRARLVYRVEDRMKIADPNLTPKVIDSSEASETDEIYSGCVRCNNAIEPKVWKYSS